ncbi:MAG: glutamate 5-kinase [Verrucomicrobia bacterium]|nr:glutamate 5-kinase [Verrucomicrobiota bacterium]
MKNFQGTAIAALFLLAFWEEMDSHRRHLTSPKPMLTHFSNARRVVVKLGTNLLTTGDGEMDEARVKSFCDQVARLRQKNIQVILVSSGAVGLGMGKLGLEKRPKLIEKLQACAAVGQSILTQTWQKHFEPFGLVVGQILLTRDDVRGRRRHVAIMNTIETLLREGVVPILNENDSVSAEELEIKFGDNDILSALVASLTKSDVLAILTTVKGLLDLDNGDHLIPIVENITPEIEALAKGTTSKTSIGGMISKIEAAKVATHSGCGVFFGAGYAENILTDLIEGKAEGTFFIPSDNPLESKKRWLAYFEKPQGQICVDAGAVKALKENGSSLLAKGILKCDSDFAADSLIEVADESGKVFARGLTRFTSDQLQSIVGKSSEEISQAFPERKKFEVIHRDDLVVIA